MRTKDEHEEPDSRPQHPAFCEERKHLQQTTANIDEQAAYLRRTIVPTADYSEQRIMEARALRLSRLERVRNNPYFGRIRFNCDDGQTEDRYIGKHGVYNEETLEPIVLDWRAPLASLFYNSSGNESSYAVNGGNVTGNVTLKRSFKIDSGQLTHIFDHESDLVADEFLLHTLAEKRDVKMTDIVATIQREQNSVIRTSPDKVVVVQGVAGSGKTSVALHRLAFLLYEYEERIKPNNVAIIAPNRMFIDYISDVLPDLGVEKVKQFTLNELFQDLLGKNVAVKADNANRETWIYRSKQSLAYRLLLEAWIDAFEDRLLASFADTRFARKYKLRGRIVKVAVPLTRDELRQLYDGRFQALPVIPRLKAIRQYVANQLLRTAVKTLREHHIDVNRRELEKITADTTAFAEKHVPLPTIDLYAAYRAALADEETMRDALADGADEETMRGALADGADGQTMWDALADGADDQTMRGAFDGQTGREAWLKELSRQQITTLCTYNEKLCAAKQFEPADLPALIILRQRVFEQGIQKNFAHLVVDEAQDIGPFAFSLLKQMTRKQSLTILGDLAQSIYPDRGITSWDELLGSVFKPEESQFFQLKQSYRSTIPIMELANTVLSHFPQFKRTVPIVRGGKKPLLRAFSSPEEVAQQIAAAIKASAASAYQMTAIVVHSEEASAHWYERLLHAGLTDIHLVKRETDALPSGLLLLPVTLAKGLEFDMVIVPDASEKVYEVAEGDAKKLYVAITRALHELHVYSIGPLSPLLNEKQ